MNCFVIIISDSTNENMKILKYAERIKSEKKNLKRCDMTWENV